MKTPIPILAAIPLLLLVACKKDNNSISISMQDVIGSWKVSSYTTDAETEVFYYPDGFNSYSVILSSDVTLTFSEDRTWTSEGEYTIEITEDSIGIDTTTYTSGFGGGYFSILDGKLRVFDLYIEDGLEITTVDFEAVAFEAGHKLELKAEVSKSRSGSWLGDEFTITTTGTKQMVLEQ